MVSEIVENDILSKSSNDMSSYNELIALINGCINRNGVQAITGRVLNGVLRAMVNQLGAGYTLGGVAHPTDYTGTPEAPVCYYASEVGTYTHFGNIQIVPGELALLCFDLTDGWFKETMYEGFESVQATIDGNVGTPAVNVTYVNGVLSFDFSNMKGNTGAAAGFGNVTAAVDGTSGTPGVSVQTDGPDTAKNIAFQFTGLKGETGVTSVIATVDNTSGTPQCAVSLNGQQLTLAFTGLKGAQGDTGSSVAYPFTIVNNLTTNDATQALSAAMGVQLESEVSQLEAKVDEFAIIDKPTDFESVGTSLGNYVSSTGALASGGTDFNVQVYKVKAGEVVTIVLAGGAGSASRLYGLYNGSTMEDVVASNKIAVGAQLGQSNGTNTINIENDCLLAVTIYRLATYTFSKVLPTGIKTVLSEIQQEVEDLNTKASIEALTKVGDIADYYIYSNGDTAYVGTDFTVAVFSVRAGDAITIKLSGGVGGAYLWALYNGSAISDVSATNKISIGNTLATSNGTNTINVLADGILAVSIYRPASYEIYRAITVTNSERIGELEKDATSRFVLENNILKVASPYGDVDLLVTLGPTGGNGLFDFIDVKTTTKDAPINVGPETLVFTAGTDWCAPFIVAAKSNIDGDNKTGDVFNEYFTGGNHQYNNTGSGSTATAELTSLAFFVDGRKVTSGKGFFRKIRIEWTNEVQAYNTTKADGSGRAVLTEKRTMEIEGNKFSATAEIIAKENITIKTWYGLQYSAVQIYPNTEYPGGVNRGVYTGVSDCGNTKPNGIFAYGASHRLEMLADVSFDIGDRRFDSDKAGAFRTATKGYLWIIHNTDFNTGERGSIRGSWRFLPVS